jgi:hypothetical protein
MQIGATHNDSTLSPQSDTAKATLSSRQTYQGIHGIVLMSLHGFYFSLAIKPPNMCFMQVTLHDVLQA